LNLRKNFLGRESDAGIPALMIKERIRVSAVTTSPQAQRHAKRTGEARFYSGQSKKESTTEQTVRSALALNTVVLKGLEFFLTWRFLLFDYYRRLSRDNCFFGN